MSIRRVLVVVAGLLLWPAIGRADALSALGEAQAMMTLLPFLAGGLGLLVAGVRYSLTDVDTGQLRRRTAVLFGLNLALGLFMALVSRSFNRHGTPMPNLWTDLYVPLACGLWAAGRARRATDALRRTKAIALVLAAALAGVGGVLGLYFPQIERSASRYDQNSAGLLAGSVALLATCALVFWQYRAARPVADGQGAAKLGWLLGVAPLLGAGYLLGLRWTVDMLDNWSRASTATYRPYYNQWSADWGEAAQTVVLYVASVLSAYFLQWALRSNSPGYQPPAQAAESKTE